MCIQPFAALVTFVITMMHARVVQTKKCSGAAEITAGHTDGRHNMKQAPKTIRAMS